MTTEKRSDDVTDSGNVTMDDYPEAVQFPEHYSFFMLAFGHRVQNEHINDYKAYSTLLEDNGWSVHPSLLSPKVSSKFSIFTPQVNSVFFGETGFIDESGGNLKEKSLDGFIEQRLDSNVGRLGCSETIFLRKKINKVWFIYDHEEPLEFKIYWVDLWLFPDGSGILSFKVESLSGHDLSALAFLHRGLRDTLSDVEVFETPHKKNKANESGTKLWRELIFNDWLDGGKIIYPNGSGDGPLFDAVFDPYQRNCKILIAAQLEKSISEEKEAEWNRPLVDPPVRYNKENLEFIRDGKSDITIAEARKSIISGYATVRDLILFELATVSDKGASVGWNRKRNFQYSLEYIREMVDNQSVEVWEYWSALGLRDTFTMVSFDHDMPLVTNQRNGEAVLGQAEDRYYPLYIYTYHLRYALDRLSEEVIDSNMADIMKGREIREKFVRFRNQYWFHEVTTDFLGFEVFEKMKLGMDVSPVYEAVKDEVEQVSAHIREKWSALTGMMLPVWSIIVALSVSNIGRELLSVLAIFAVFLGFGIYYEWKPVMVASDKFKTLFKPVYRKLIIYIGKNVK